MRPSRIVWLLLTGCGAGASSPTDVEVMPVVEPAGVVHAPPVAASAPPLNECSLSWEPRSLGASVLTIPPETASLMMAPVIDALCACTRPGSQHSIVVDFEPGRGRALAHDSDHHTELDRCLEPRLGDNMYPAFDIGSDCIDCGPKRYGVFGGPAPEPRGSRIRMPLRVDRSSELQR